MKYKEVEDVLIQNGFTLKRQTGSHRICTATINRKKQRVTLSYHRIKDDVRLGTLASIIQQSALDKELFRNKKRMGKRKHKHPGSRLWKPIASCEKGYYLFDRLLDNFAIATKAAGVRESRKIENF